MKCGIGSYNDRLTDDFINGIVSDLCRPESYASVYHRTYHDFPMPSVESLRNLKERLQIDRRSPGTRQGTKHIGTGYTEAIDLSAVPVPQTM